MTASAIAIPRARRPRNGRLPWGSPAIYFGALVVVALMLAPILYIIIGGFRTTAEEEADMSIEDKLLYHPYGRLGGDEFLESLPEPRPKTDSLPDTAPRAPTVTSEESERQTIERVEAEQDRLRAAREYAEEAAQSEPSEEDEKELAEVRKTKKGVHLPPPDRSGEDKDKDVHV